MKQFVSILVMLVTGSDILGLIELPLYASIGIFLVALLIVLDTVFGTVTPKDSKTKDQG